MAKTTKRRALDRTRIASLYKKLKSVSAVAKEVGGSYMDVRRSLIIRNFNKGKV